MHKNKNKLNKDLLIAIPTFYPDIEEGGPIISLYNQLYDLNKKFSFSVFINKNKKKINLSIRNSNPFIKYKIFQVNSFLNYLKYIKSIKKFKYIHVHSIFSFFCLYTIFFSFFFKKKTFISPRGSIGIGQIKKKYIIKKIIIYLIKIIISNNLTFIVTSKLEKTDIKKFFPKSSIIILPNGLNNLDLKIEEKQKKLPINISYIKKSIIFYSRIDKKKNLHHLVNYINTQNKFNLIIIGPISDYNYFSDLNINSKKIIYLGPIYNFKTLKLIFSNSLFLCLLSKYENFANVILESINFDTPVLITKNIGLSNLISVEKFGLIIKKIDFLNDYVNNLILNRDYFKKSIKSKKSKIISYYSWKKINIDYIRIITKS